MKRKGLCLMIALALGGVVFAAQAQDVQDSGSTSTSSTQYDGRWYVGPSIGAYFSDSDRQTSKSDIYYGFSFGKFVSKNTSIDVFLDHVGRNVNGANAQWDSNALGVDARFYFRDWNEWRPFISAGIMGDHHSSYLDHGWAPAAQVGGGLSKVVAKHAIFRVGATYRYDFDDQSQPSQNGYGDWMVGISLLALIGNPPAPPPPPAPVAPPPPPAPTCDQLDSDGDHVNNCVDKCPNTPAGTIVGPDGCVQKVVIDLRGVNFKFDRPHKGEAKIGPTLKTPSSSSIAILNQAVDTLKRYPKVVVKVVGYTDSVGSDAYNEKLSDRRAKIVYDYLTSHGISASRLEGPVGQGENAPVATNKTKDGRARNRRVELKVDQSASGVKVEQTNNGTSGNQ